MCYSAWRSSNHTLYAQFRCIYAIAFVCTLARGIIDHFHAEGAVIFRVQGRQLLSTDGRGKWEEQVVFTAPVRLLFWKPTTRTRVHQHIDASNAECITVDFRLLHSVGISAAGQLPAMLLLASCAVPWSELRSILRPSTPQQANCFVAADCARSVFPFRRILRNTKIAGNFTMWQHRSHVSCMTILAEP